MDVVPRQRFGGTGVHRNKRQNEEREGGRDVFHLPMLLHRRRRVIVETLCYAGPGAGAGVLIVAVVGPRRICNQVRIAAPKPTVQARYSKK